MNEGNQENLRRQHVFRILDELKERGERINADKVARIGKMGKQTVLPYYNEWRFLGTLGEEQNLEIPDEVITGLKRGIAKWKYQLAEEQRSFEETANQEIDELKATLKLITDKNDELTKKNSDLVRQNEQMQSELDSMKMEVQDKELQKHDLESLLQSEQKQVVFLKATLKEQKQAHQQSMNNLEKQLDQRHQEQLNHWLSVVDDERRLKQGLEKNIAKLREKQEELARVNIDIQGRLDIKSKAYIQACEERNQLSLESQKAVKTIELSQQLEILLDCEQKDILKSVRALQGDSKDALIINQQYQAERSTNEKLEARLSEMEKRVSRFSEIELELERARGIAEALEKTLSGNVEVSKI